MPSLFHPILLFFHHNRYYRIVQLVACFIMHTMSIGVHRLLCKTVGKLGFQPSYKL